VYFGLVYLDVFGLMNDPLGCPVTGFILKLLFCFSFSICVFASASRSDLPASFAAILSFSAFTICLFILANSSLYVGTASVFSLCQAATSL